jgi:hypothetical protein
MGKPAPHRARARRLVEGLDPTLLPARVRTTCETLDAVLHQESYERSWNSHGKAQTLKATETIYEGEWSVDNTKPEEEERSRGELGEPLPANWWEKDRFDDPTRLRRIRRATRELRGASVPWLVNGARLLLITATRKHYTKTTHGAERFRAAVKVFEAQLAQVGCLGGATVWECKGKLLHPSDMKCCKTEGPGCPLCSWQGEHSEVVPSVHLHAHMIVVVPSWWKINYGWLQQLYLPRQLDPSWGALDVAPGSATKGADALGAYVGGYLARLKDRSGMQTALLRRYLGNRAQTLTRWGVLRGAARAGTDVWVSDETETTTEITLERSILVRQRERKSPDVAARARDAARVLREIGVPLGKGQPWQTWVDVDMATYEAMEAWRVPSNQRTKPRPPRKGQLVELQERKPPAPAAPWT